MRNQTWIDETNGRLASFKVSGALMDNNLVMIDLESKSTWPQLYWTANAGPRMGECLEFHRNAVATTWGFWRSLHPDTRVMSNRNEKKTSIRPEWYGNNPYRDYHAGREPTPYPITRVDGRLHERDIVLGVHGESGRAAVLVSKTLARTEIGETPVVLFSHLPSRTTWVFENRLDGLVREFGLAGDDENGIPRFRDVDSGTIWSIDGIGISGPLAGRRLAQMPSLHLYWFAWATFFPGEPIIRL